jgi:hypothetical protein
LEGSIAAQETKVNKLKEKRKNQKREIKALREEKLELEVQRGNVEANIGEQAIRIERLEKTRES